MKTYVYLHDVLKNKVKLESYDNKAAFSIILNPGSSVEDLLKSLGLSQDWVGLIIVNGKQVGLDYLFSDQDRVDLFSPMAGG